MNTTVVSPWGEALTWAGSRLRLGQANVGWWVVVATLVLLLQPAAQPGTLPQEALLWVVCVAVYTVLQLPFDAVGGHVLPVRFGRQEDAPLRWMSSWARGAAFHAGILTGSGWVALVISRAAGDYAAAIGLAVLGGLMVALQGPLVAWASGRAPEPASARWHGALHEARIDPARVDVFVAGDRSFVGGWVGARGLERLMVPARWLEVLDNDLLHALLVRRRIALEQGSRAHGVISALAFNGLGLAAVVALVPGAGFTNTSALVVTAAGSTLWAFVGLLCLPTVSRWAVHRLDRMAAQELDRQDALTKAISVLDRDQEDEDERGPVVGAVFHPVPTPSSRHQSLQRPWPTDDAAAPGLWRVARMALFTSPTTLSALSRAVHCNIGRPELWFLPPGD